EEKEKEKKKMSYAIESLIKTAMIQAESAEKLEATMELRGSSESLESLLVPPPLSNLTIDYEKGSARLSWRLPPPVDVYEMYVDGRLEGHVSGRKTTILLSNFNASSIVQLRAVR
ncbi:hypothetical protein PENTCL1PPCAC_5059, partial [Pristionchus entomophagus]